MANVSGTGTVWNLPNYAGDLFTADSTNTPILSAIGGLTGGGRGSPLRNRSAPCKAGRRAPQCRPHRYFRAASHSSM